jgi:hypothetical protein
LRRYEGKLVFARRAGILRGLMTGVGGGVTWLIIYASYSLAFYYGSKLIINDREKCGFDMDCYRYDPSSLLIVSSSRFEWLRFAKELPRVSYAAGFN